jgi:hypothetical protein
MRRVELHDRPTADLGGFARHGHSRPSTGKERAMKQTCVRRLVCGLGAAAILVLAAPAPPAEGQMAMQGMRELFEFSQKEKRGLTFFVQGQSIPGVVTKILGEEAVEVRNQTFGRLIIRIDRIDALALN